MAGKRTHVMTPARKAALRKAQLASANSRRGKRTGGVRRRYSSDVNKRGVGAAGLRKNLTPYARVNKSSQTVGFNTGTVIPFTGRRVAFGNYFRLEKTNKNNNALDRALNKMTKPGSRAGKVRSWFGQNVEVKNPAIRARIPGGEARLGTSRRAGPTIIVRARSHQTPFKKSRSGVRRYDRAIAGKKVKRSRAQRRK